MHTELGTQQTRTPVLSSNRTVRVPVRDYMDRKVHRFGDDNLLLYIKFSKDVCQIMILTYQKDLTLILLV